jgi:two-component system chemotaxis sensor kinase CheA
MSRPSLETIAALLVQLETDDTAEIGRLAAALDEHVGASTPAVGKLLSAAAQRLRLALLNPQHAAAEVAHASQLLHAAGAVAAIVKPPAPPVGKPATSSVAIAVDSELVIEFIAESRDHLAKAEMALLALEKSPSDGDSVGVVFRAFHTVKGTAAILELTPIGDVAHHAESLLVKVRDGQVPFSTTHATLSLRAVDTMKAMLDVLERQPDAPTFTPPPGVQELLADLVRENDASPSPPRAPSAPPPSAVADLFLPTVMPNPSRPPTQPSELLLAPQPIAPAPVLAAPTLAAGAPNAPLASAMPVLAHDHDAGPVSMYARESSFENLTPPNGVRHTPAPLSAASPTQAPRVAVEASDNSVRVRTDRLDRLVDLVGELVIAQSMVSQDSTLAQPQCAELAKKAGRLFSLVRELQELSISLRMVPLRSTFQRMNRVVRDTAKKAGRQVELITEGEETEIDRHMVDALADPLVHMVRNAVDHGIESPAERIAAGKSPKGTVRLRALHTSGSVVVELRDDGGGLDRQKLVNRAIQKKLITSDAGMSDAEVYDLIFEPGFSTKEQVTEISGRGVGMDVVRKNIAALNGRIEITSELGKGTTFRVLLPLTLAITDGMLIRVGAERFIVPTASIRITLRPEREQLAGMTGGSELLMLRGEALPILRLHQLFDIAGARADATEGVVVVINDRGATYAMQVDELLGQQQVVAKPLGALGRVAGISGGAILGDGRVGLILDTAALATLAEHTRSANSASSSLVH